MRSERSNVIDTFRMAFLDKVVRKTMYGSSKYIGQEPLAVLKPFMYSSQVLIASGEAITIFYDLLIGQYNLGVYYRNWNGTF